MEERDGQGEETGFWRRDGVGRGRARYRERKSRLREDTKVRLAGQVGERQDAGEGQIYRKETASEG